MSLKIRTRNIDFCAKIKIFSKYELFIEIDPTENLVFYMMKKHRFILITNLYNVTRIIIKTLKNNIQLTLFTFLDYKTNI